jgi:hypothetical protein
MSAGRRRWNALPGAWKPACSSLSQPTMRSAQRAANRRRISPGAAQRQVMVDEQRRGHAAIGMEDLFAPLRRHRLEGQGVVRRVAKAEGARARAVLGLGEPGVDRAHQRVRRAEVGAEHVVPAGGGAAGLQVAVDVRAAKSVDRLLGVADQQQRAARVVVGGAVERVEEAVLQRRGVLELVDQRHRVLGEDALAQARAVRPGEGAVETVEQVGEAEAARLALELGEALADPGGGVDAQRGARVGQGVVVFDQAGEGGEVLGQHGRRGVGLARLEQAVWGEAVAGAVGELEPAVERVARPLFERLQPGRVIALVQLGAIPQLGLGGEFLVQPVLHGARALGPATRERHPRPAVRAADAPDQRGQGFATGRIAPHAVLVAGIRAPIPVPAVIPIRALQRLADERAHVLDEGVHVGPLREYELQRLAGERVAVLAPVVLRGLGQQHALVGGELLVEGVAAVEGVFAQHALAPGVDGEHRRVVHGRGRHRQAPGGVAARGRVGVGSAQFVEQGVGCAARIFVAEPGRSLAQALADALGELARGGAGEGHHQDLGGQQRTREGGVGVAVAEHQAQVERGDGPGLAGSGAGLDEAAAAQRKAGGVEAVAHRADSWVSGAGWGTASTWLSIHSSSGP